MFNPRVCVSLFTNKGGDPHLPTKNASLRKSSSVPLSYVCVILLLWLQKWPCAGNLIPKQPPDRAARDLSSV